MALIPTPAKTELILLIRVPYIFCYSAELRTVNNVGHILWMKNVSPYLIINWQQRMGSLKKNFRMNKYKKKFRDTVPLSETYNLCLVRRSDYKSIFSAFLEVGIQLNKEMPSREKV
jgi:hypothetical protein